jgi:hypothetical protein
MHYPKRLKGVKKDKNENIISWSGVFFETYHTYSIIVTIIVHNIRRVF